MARPTWTVSLEVRLLNGSRGSVHVEDDDLVNFREVAEAFQRTLDMARQLKPRPVEQEQTPAEAHAAAHLRAVK